MAKRCFLLFLPLIIFSFFTSSLAITKSDLDALREIRDSLKDVPSSATRFFSSWDFSAADPCTTFAGVTCFSSRVTILSLGTGLSDSRGLQGTLSPAITKLTELNQLILFSGFVTGPIPFRLGDLHNLKVISLTNNLLNGDIPAAIFNLPNLHTLDLSHNQLSGRIPPAMPGSNMLKVLILSNNKLGGNLPSSLWNQLLHLDLKNNYLTGTLPGKLPWELRYLSLSNNRMWGPIVGMELLSELAYLDLSMNSFSGPIPGYLFRQRVKSMLLQRNNLSGRVPDSPPWTYGAGSIVDLSHNSLTGVITPAFIGVETLFLNNNLLNGQVHEAYVQSVKSGTMKTLYLQHNYLTGFPIEKGYVLPGATAVCLCYNCMSPLPLGMSGCPASAGDQPSRPANQCPAVHIRSSSSLA